MLNPASCNIFKILAVSKGSPAAFHCLVNFLALTAVPSSLAPALTLLAALPTAPNAPLAKFPRPRFAFAPIEFGLSKGSSPCAGSFSIKNNSNRSSMSSASAFAGAPPPCRSNSPCSGSIGSPPTLRSMSFGFPSTVCNEPCAAAAIILFAAVRFCRNASLDAATFWAISFVRFISSINCFVSNDFPKSHNLSNASSAAGSVVVPVAAVASFNVFNSAVNSSTLVSGIAILPRSFTLSNPGNVSDFSNPTLKLVSPGALSYGTASKRIPSNQSPIPFNAQPAIAP